MATRSQPTRGVGAVHLSSCLPPSPRGLCFRGNCVVISEIPLRPKADVSFQTQKSAFKLAPLKMQISPWGRNLMIPCSEVKQHGFGMSHRVSDPRQVFLSCVAPTSYLSLDKEACSSGERPTLGVDGAQLLGVWGPCK